MKNTVIFDLDGTLLNTLDNLTNNINAALEYMNFPKRTTEEIRHFVGDGMRMLVNRAVPAGTPDEKIENTFKYFCEYYFAHCDEKTAPYDGIMQMLNNLVKQNYKLAVVSNKRIEAVEELCRKYFSMITVISADQPGMKRKPAADGIENVLRQLSSKKSDAVYVGDSEVDILTAKNAEIDCISVTWGFRTKKELLDNGAVNVISHPDELLELLKKFENTICKGENYEGFDCSHK